MSHKLVETIKIIRSIHSRDLLHESLFITPIVQDIYRNGAGSMGSSLCEISKKENIKTNILPMQDREKLEIKMSI